MRRKGVLILSDGSRYQGQLVGAESNVGGEVVFHSAMTGYRLLSDPAVAGQIVIANISFVEIMECPPRRKRRTLYL